MMKYILQLEGGVNLVNMQDDRGSTPLSYIATTHDIPHRRTRKMVQLLLQHGADIHARDDTGNMAAHYFARRGWVVCLWPLMDAGFDLHSRGENGATILHHAVVGGTKMIKYLLGLNDGKMIIDIKNLDGKTPLQCAYNQSNPWPTIFMLMRHGATRPCWCSSSTRARRNCYCLAWLQPSLW